MSTTPTSNQSQVAPNIPKNYDPKSAELKWSQYWDEQKINNFDRSPQAAGKHSAPVFSVDTPPPTVSGKLHIGHVFSYSQTDPVARYQRMKGANVYYPMGFDDNGLPTEKFVEKSNKVSALQMPRADFIELCLKVTQQTEAENRKLWQRLGLSIDWTTEYSTISQRAQKISQKSFLDLLAKGLVYQKKDPVLWSTEMRTAIAQAEVDHIDKPSFFHTIYFKADNGEALEIATTRPELLGACVALLVHPDNPKGKHLIGRTATTPLYERKVPIIADEKALMDKGTGWVMCCTFGDKTDIEWVRKHKLPVIELIGEDGKLSAAGDFLQGLYAEPARKEIVSRLEHAGLLKESKPIVHNVAIHERTGREVEFVVTRQWYIRILEKKPDFLRLGEELKWHPEYMKQRYMDWVEGLSWDWCVSRQRHFGIPIPVWLCEGCGQVIAATEAQLPVDPQTMAAPVAHCPQCQGQKFKPETLVLDTWATSSVTPEINAGWGTDNDISDQLLPMSMRPQAHDIIRTWAFYTIVKSYYHHQRLPWKNIAISGHVLTDAKEKISKSKSNTTHEPWALLEKFSADTIRFWAYSAKIGKDTKFSEEEIQNGQRLVTKLWNASKFAHLLLADFEKPENIESVVLSKATYWSDRYFIASFQNTVQRVTQALDDFEFHDGLKITERFFWDMLCDVYIEMVKKRLYQTEKYSAEMVESARYTLYYLTLNCIKLLAVFVPFITEEVFQLFFKKPHQVSIHKESWPQVLNLKSADEEAILKSGLLFKEAVTLLRSQKTAQGLSIGKELAELNFTVNPENSEMLKKFSIDLQDLANAQAINWTVGSGELQVTLKALT